jgi:hypothetical protein
MADCHLGVRCRRFDRRTRTPALATDRGLCYTCERHGQHAIRQLVVDYMMLAQELPPGSAGIASGSHTKPDEAPLPLRADVDSMMREIHWMLIRWEIAVRLAARLSPAPCPVRMGVDVARSSSTLDTHYSVLMALGPTLYGNYTTFEWTRRSGLDAIADLADLHYRAEVLIGLPPRREHRVLPCPGPPISDGCGDTELYTYIGSGAHGESNEVRCATCGWRCTMDQYMIYASLDPRKAFA